MNCMEFYYLQLPSYISLGICGSVGLLFLYIHIKSVGVSIPSDKRFSHSGRFLYICVPNSTRTTGLQFFGRTLKTVLFYDSEQVAFVTHSDPNSHGLVKLNFALRHLTLFSQKNTAFLFFCVFVYFHMRL